jgi:hypothetical protein
MPIMKHGPTHSVASHHIGLPSALILAAAVLAAATAAPLARAAQGDEEIVSVSSKAWKGYVRDKLPDGSLAPEYYAFGNGGRVSGPMVDTTIDKLSFMDIAKVVARPLANRRYVPASDPEKTKLLIMVYWGTTTGVKDPSNQAVFDAAQASQAVVPPPQPSQTSGPVNQAFVGPGSRQTIDDASLDLMMVANRQRENADLRNAMLLGYESELAETANLENTALKGAREGLMSDLEDNRYFVILMAYDFQTAWKMKKHKLLWETRISLRQRGNDFGKRLPEMVLNAEKYFGEDTDGLVRNRIPEGRVDIGEPKVIDNPGEK